MDLPCAVFVPAMYAVWHFFLPSDPPTDDAVDAFFPLTPSPPTRSINKSVLALSSSSSSSPPISSRSLTSSEICFGNAALFDFGAAEGAAGKQTKKRVI